MWSCLPFIVSLGNLEMLEIIPDLMRCSSAGHSLKSASAEDFTRSIKATVEGKQFPARRFAKEYTSQSAKVLA